METAPLKASESRQCADCGARLPGGAFGDCCPTCLFELGFVLKSNLTSGSDDGRSEERSASADQGNGSRLPGPPSFGDYVLMEEIGRGGMGVVCKARQVSLNRIVAVKMIPRGPLPNADCVQRFRTEAETVASLRHSNIVAIHEIGEHEGRQYFSMDYVPGGNLAERVRDKPLAPDQAALWIKTIAEAVSYAHGLGILHRDLKPSNVLIDTDGQPRITDFGLAKRLAAETELTRTGQVIGSPAFIPPEQAAGRLGEMGPQSDIYALGAILYFLLTARPPLLADTLETTLWQVIHVEPAAPRLLNPVVPADLETICLKCLEKDPTRRYATAQDLADDLGRFLSREPIRARPLGPLGRALRWCARNPKLAGLAAVSGTLLIGVIAVTAIANVRLHLKEITIRQTGYVADLRLAQQALELDNLGLAERLLRRQRPPPGQPDLRGWEWRNLWAQSRSDALFSPGSHENAVLTAAFSPNGQRLASADIDGTVKLWDLVSWREIARQQHRDRVDTLVFTADGKRLASGSRDGEVRFWDGATLAETGPPLYPGHRLVALRFSEDGERLVTIGLEPGTRWLGAKAITWDLHRQQAVDEQEIQAWWRAAFSPDGTILATGGMNGEIWLRNLATRTEIASWTAHSNSVSALVFSPDGQRLVSGGFNRDVKVWDVRAGREESTLRGLGGTVSAAAFSPDGKILAAAGYDQTLRLWDTTDWRQVATFRGQMSEVWALAYSPGGDLLATGGKGGTIKLWNPRSSPSRPRFSKLLDEGKIGYLSPSAMVVWRTSQFCLLDPTLFSRSLVDGTARELAWNPPPTWPAGREESEGSTIQAGLRFFDTPGVRLSALAASAARQWVALGTDEGEVYLWDMASPAAPRRMGVGPSIVTEVEFSPNAQHLAAAIGRQRIILLAVPTGQTIAQFDRRQIPFLEMEFTPDGRSLAVGYEDGVVALWDLARGVVVRSLDGHKLWVTAMAFSPDGRQLATASEDGTVNIWDTASARKLSTLEGKGSALWSVSWSPDSRRLATGTGESTILIWDLATGQDVATLKGHKHAIVRANFLPDGNSLISYAMDEVFLWHAPPFEELEPGPATVP